MNKYVIGNWKMNGSWEENSLLLNLLKNNINKSSKVKTVVCVPYPYLVQAKGLLLNSNISYGAQDLSTYNNGAYTGEVSAGMLADLGCKYVIVGHSERRIYFKESNELVANKTKIALQNNLTPIVCIGETLEQRQSNQTFNILEIQLKAILDELTNDQIPNIILAYEPIWAIGTGQSATKEQAQEVHNYLRKICLEYNKISPSILYGGSLKANNAQEIFAMQDIDGGLIGGASLIANEFLAISNSL